MIPFVHARCGAWKTDDDGWLLVCSESAGHSDSRQCYDSDKDVYFHPEHRIRRNA